MKVVEAGKPHDKIKKDGSPLQETGVLMEETNHTTWSRYLEIVPARARQSVLSCGRLHGAGRYPKQF